MFRIWMIGFLVISGAVWAESMPIPEKKPKYCKALEDRTSAAYKPGVDVHGNDVVSADLNQNLKPIFDPIEIPIEVDLVDRFMLDVPDGVELKPAVAAVRIYQDGRVEYNGQDVSSQAYSLCGDGQAAPEALQNTHEQEETQNGDHAH